MLVWNVWILFVGYAVPLVISPGPGNTVLTAMGAQHGVRGSVRFWVGFEIGNLALCLIYGFGLGEVVRAHPGFAFGLKLAGIAYLLYLAWSFFRSASHAASLERRLQPHLGLVDGILAVAVNPKIHSMVLAMFTQFLDPAAGVTSTVIQLTTGFVLISVLCHFLWIYAGASLLGRFRSERAQRTQGWAFGTCMLLVAAFTAIN
ncbi:LysE family translocator [Labrys sp. KB_33_2]|uniref:LysE family translocator n=1 Tax=Labrys sp. KB_33_2 TaxID=3237479 RepID=UPI003F915BC1